MEGTPSIDTYTHFKEICKQCSDIIRQCRGCTQPNKPIFYDICEQCKTTGISGINFSMNKLKEYFEKPQATDTEWRNNVRSTLKNINEEIEKFLK